MDCHFALCLGRRSHEKLTYPISGGLNTRLTTVIKPSRVLKEIVA